MSTATMAKKKTGPKPSAEGPREAMVTMKCRQAYKAWLVGFSKAERITPSFLIDLSLAEYAKARGYKAPPER